MVKKLSLIHEFPELKELDALVKRSSQKVHLVGGFLRDVVLDRLSHDLDFTVDSKAIALAEKFAQRIKGAFVLLDDDNGCARVVKKRQGQIITFDFADWRAKTLRGDIAHRDFTINTMSCSLTKVLKSSDVNVSLMSDPLNGLSDLKIKTIRMTQAQTFEEDPLRLMRAFSLSAQLGFKIEKETLKQIKHDVRLILNVSKERVRDELFKVLDSPRAFKTLRAMDRIGLLRCLIPTLQEMVAVHQGGYHHLDVWKHSLEVVNQFEKIDREYRDNENVQIYLAEGSSQYRTRRALLKLGCLLHDIGKPQTKKIEGARTSFHSHEHVGAQMTKTIGRQLKLSTKERHALENYVRLHLRPGYLSNFKRPTKKAVFRYFRDAKEEAIAVLLLAMADQRSTRGPLTTEQDQQHHAQLCQRLIEEYFVEEAKPKPVKLISGDDLKKQFGLKPGPMFKEILTFVDEQQALGKISSKEEALEIVEKKFIHE